MVLIRIKLLVNNNPKTKIRNPMTELNVKENERVQMITNKKKERFVSYVSGQAGSGKSYSTNKLAEEYHSIYIKCKHIKRIKLDENFLKTELTLGDMKNSLIIYDDVDN